MINIGSGVKKRGEGKRVLGEKTQLPGVVESTCYRVEGQLNRETESPAAC